MEFDTKGEHIGSNDVVDNFAKWNSTPVYDHYKGDEDVVEESRGQLIKNVKSLAFCFHDYIWDEFIDGALVKRNFLDKELPFAHYWSFLFSFMIWKPICITILLEEKEDQSIHDGNRKYIMNFVLFAMLYEL
ncbi:hypothetical protein DVH24_038067 [Malus domestica]|uniref:Uncharacterized protein n=1 Tax=Malus domestica TaxID=3750 RepID=A0A498KEA2_MALDO|nr:hypothetical protein DVH24_038067 [Malus domestica]